MRLELKNPAAKGGAGPGIRTPIVLDGLRPPDAAVG